MCGNGTCDDDAGETLATCSADCFDPSLAFNGICDPGENPILSMDCQGTYPDVCGDGYCGMNESESSCCPPEPIEVEEEPNPPPCPATGGGCGLGDGCTGMPTQCPGESAEAFSARLYAWTCDIRRTRSCGSFACTRVTERYQLLLSNYNVGGTLGNGEHQGLGVRLVTRYVDRRTSEVCQETGTGAQGAGIILYLWNHGRTVNTGFRQVGWAFRANYRVEMEKTASFNWWDAYDNAPGNDTEYEQSWSLFNCVVAMPDGFCDHACGNDGYTLPSALISRRTRACPANTFTNKDAHAPPGVPLGCAQRLGSRTIRLPRWGHNSNNDATAARAWFSACGTTLNNGQRRSSQAWLNANAEGVCNGNCDSTPVANGCFTQTNIARSKVAWCNGCMNLSTNLPGDLPGGQPTADCYNRGAGAACAAGGVNCPFPPGKGVTGM
jgi:hypothetical protein